MIFIDSDFIIDYLRGDEKTIDIVNNIKDEITTTEINVFEVMFGIYLKQNISQKQINEAKEFFNALNIFSFSSKCGEKSAEILSELIKKGKEINQNDCFIASIILENGFSEIPTNNKIVNDVDAMQFFDWPLPSLIEFSLRLRPNREIKEVSSGILEHTHQTFNYISMPFFIELAKPKYESRITELEKIIKN